MSKYSMPEDVKKYAQSNPIDESIFKKFLADELTVKEVKQLNEEMTNRFVYIVYKIGEMTSFNVDWFDYDNEGGEYAPGTFNTDDYAQNVGYTGKFIYEKGDRFSDYDNSFPTNWFYEEFETSLQKEVKDYFHKKKIAEEEKQQNKQKKEDQLSKIKEKILSKLTEEEKLYIRFCSPSEVSENKKIEASKSRKDVAKYIKEMKEKNVDVSGLYQSYRDKTKSPISFEKWIAKNKKKIES